MTLLRRRSRLSAAVAGLAAVVALAGCTPVTAPPYETGRTEGERFLGGRVLSDPTASAGAALGLMGNGTASGTVAPPVLSTWVEVRARGDQCAGAPVMTLRVDGRPVATTSVTATGWTTYGYTGSWAAGRHAVTISYANDYLSRTCDRNLRVDYIAFRSATPVPAATNLFTHPYYVDPASAAATAAAALKTTDPTSAALLGKIAGQPAADWFTDAVPAGSVAAAVKARVDTIAAAGRLPVLVAYAIPNRDCGGASAGGLATSAQYQSWITNLAAGIGSRTAVVVLEPDSLAQLDCLPAPAQSQRLADLRAAVTALGASRSIAVYLDGGHASWQPVAVMAARLRGAGVADARGFATNVANFNTVADEVAYGNALATALGGKHYVVDTSRNGAGPAGTAWCNPPGRGLGPKPTSSTGATSADAYFWIKRPGESDGDCGIGDPPAGTWFRSAALDLAAHAAW